MEIKKLRMTFAIAGDFVTNIARSWFWDEGRPWEDVEEFLLSCMCGTDESQEDLHLHAVDVVFGRAKFIGNTQDGSFALTGDDNELLPVQKYTYAKNRCKEYEEDYIEMAQQYSELTSWLIDNGHGYLLKRFERESGRLIEGDDEPVVSPMLESFMQQAKIEKQFEDNYGWLDPLGNFYPEEWGGHHVWAEKKVDELGFRAKGVSGDTELAKRGWVLLHSPSRGIPVVSMDETRRLTKPQREFLFGYYTDRGLDKEAKKYLED